MAKVFTYRGKTIEELQQLDTREFSKHLKSRSRRAVLRQFDQIENFIARSERKRNKGKQIRTHLRHIVIVPRMVGLTVFIYNGQNFNKIIIMPEMLGHRLGEFSVTRNKVKHGSAGVGATRSSASKSVK